MKKFLLTGILISVAMLNAWALVSLDDFLNRKEVKEVRVLKNESAFERVLEVMIEQPVDHRNPDGETFSQRIYISHQATHIECIRLLAYQSDSEYYASIQP